MASRCCSGAGRATFDFHTGLEAAKRENAELREAHVVLRRAAEDARSRLADAESRLRRSENTSVEDKNAHASRARQLQTLEREKDALARERDALQKTNTVQNDQIEAERQRHDDREAVHQRELACSRALGLAHAASLSARIAHLEASCAISKAAITAAAPARERAVAEALARAEADHTKRSSLARTILAEKDSKVEILRRRVAELESELASGGHEHRKFVEIAERQARREGALASEAAQSKLATSRLKRAIRDRDSEVADLASQLLACQKKLEDARRGLGRDATNLEYVKNLLVQYFSLRQNSSEQASLVPVLATVLAFTDDDLTLLRAQAQKWEASQSYWGGSSEPDAPNPLLTLTTLAPAPRHRKASPVNTGT
jgi:chromosome segregation ATPase